MTEEKYKTIPIRLNDEGEEADYEDFKRLSGKNGGSVTGVTKALWREYVSKQLAKEGKE
jgi:hypothetical protein